MKFYLTKAAQLEAEGRSPQTPKASKPAKPGKTPKPEKPSRSSTIAPSSAPIPGAPTLPDARALGAASTTPVTRTATAPSAVSSVEVPASAGTESRRARQTPRPAAEKPVKPPKGIIAVGGLPRVDLLPPEVRAERRAAVNVRRAWTAVVGLVVIVGLAGGTAAVYAQGSESTLSAAQKQTAYLAAQTSEFSEVKKVKGQVDLMDAARMVGGSTDIDWPSYLAKVKATVPNGMALSTVTIDSASPIAAYTQSSTPLEAQRVATLTFTATSTSLPSVPTWLSKLASLPGYTDAQAGTVTQETGVYTANVVVHIDKSAFSHVYTKAGK